MARPLRLEYPGAVYHVIARGHGRSSIFRDDRDRGRFLALLGRVAQDEEWEVQAYCLMSNHYHLLIETPRGSLSRGMKAVNGRYAQWLNGRYNRHGQLFEGRFRSVLVQKEKHLLELIRHVVLNPVRAGAAERAGDWRWSSYRATAGLERVPGWLQVDWVLSQFARSRRAARIAYRRFVAEGKGSGKAIELLERGPYLGDREFRARVQKLLQRKGPADEIPQRYRRAIGVNLGKIRRIVAKEWKVEVEALSRMRGGDEKRAAIYLARRLTRLSGREIGAAFGVKPARVSNVVTEIERGVRPALARRLERLRRRLGRGL